MLVAELFSGPLDIIGDVHGELDTLSELINKLGYERDGSHPHDRRLVFVGDLTDRGPDSPGVVRLVSRLIDAGRAQCVLGNHELNILRWDRKDGNAWFFGERDEHEGRPTPEVLADERTQDEVLRLFSRLPLGLEREDLRVVHACWHEEHATTIREAAPTNAVSFAKSESERIESELRRDGRAANADYLKSKHDLRDQSTKPPMLEVVGDVAAMRQNDHPVKVMTSGIEERSAQPYFVGGRWRFEQRVKWWDEYEGPMVVVGHYWRSRYPERNPGKGPNLFEGTDPHAPLGRGHVMCVDYSIGYRNKERIVGAEFTTALAAYRWPERELVFSD